ncbi:MAG: pitrilysin family protein [Thermoanaerobaculia bacterium]
MRFVHDTAGFAAAAALSIGLALGPAAFADPPSAAAAEVSARPEQLTYKPFQFDVPDGAKVRHTLPGGVVVYVVEDHSLPLVKLQATFRTGAFREGADETGLAAMTAAMMRQGGTTKLTPEEFDQKADFLAAVVTSSAGATSASAALDVITPALDSGLDLLFDMVRNPRFDEARLAVQKSTALEEMKQRNDDAGDIADREWDFLSRGEKHYSARRMTQADLEALTREKLVAFHRRTWGPEHLVLAVSGDVDSAKILADLGKRLAGWKAGEPQAAWPPSGPDFTPPPGLFHIEKDIPQGKVTLGELGIQWKNYSDPEPYALTVMNDILGGGGFTARLMKRVRSDEGLAYGAYSQFGIGTFWPGLFEIGFASKNPTVALATKIVLEEVEKIRTGLVSDEELRVSKRSFIDTFPRTFESPAATARTFANDEVIGRPHSYWTEYRNRIEAVTAADVQTVAAKYLDSGKLAMLVVGKWDEIAPGDATGRAKMAELFGGQVKHLPLRDPLTLVPLPQ